MSKRQANFSDLRADTKTMSRISIFLNKNRIVLYLILLYAFLVRVIGMGWHLPYTYYLDEEWTVGMARRFLTEGGFNPRGWFIYPPLNMYIQTSAYKIYYLFGRAMGFFHSVSDMNRIGFFLVGRFTTALLGVGTVLLVYLIGKKIYSRKVGLISSLFLCLTFLHIRYSRVITPDVPMTFFIVLSFLFVYLIYKTGKARYYILAAIFAGFSVATKYTGAFLVIPIFLAHLFYNLEQKKALFRIFLNKKFLFLFLFIILGFFIGCPHAFIEFSTFLRTLRGISAGMNTVRLPYTGETNSWLYYITTALSRGMGLLLQIFSLAGIAYGMFRHRKKDILLVSFPLAFFLFMGSYLHHPDRYIIPMIPFLVIFAAMFIVEIVSKISLPKKKQNFIVVALTLAIVFLPGIRVARFVHLTTEKSTGIQAKEWIEKNIPSGSRIAVEQYCPRPSREMYKLRNVAKVGFFPLEWYKKRNFNYITTSSFTYDRYFRTRLRRFRSERQNYETVNERCELVKQFGARGFSPFIFLLGGHNPNPIIKIYRIDYKHPYFKFSGNFERYSQRIALKKVDKGWLLKSSISCGKSRIRGEYVENPYVRIMDSKGREIAKLVVHQGRVGESPSNFGENSVFLPSLPSRYKLYVGYECKYESDSTSTNPLREIELKFGDKFYLPRKDYSIQFVGQRIPYINAAEYNQAVAIFQSGKKNILWSKIYAGELVVGDDYVLNPYVKLVDSKEKEVAKFFIYEGEVGGKVSVHGPRENWVNIPELPLEYKVYIGYEYYCDASHREKAGGPLEIEIGKMNLN